MVGLAIAADTVGVDRGTLRRWRWRRDHGLRLARRRGPRPVPISEAVHSEAAEAVRQLRGLIGADALRRSCPGLTRRGAARIKAETATAMERERRNSAGHVYVPVPGVLRGFDSMKLGAAGHLLVSADGAVPYRTSWMVTPRYDGASAALALDHDFARNGAPLVVRLDRARQHDVAAVHAVLTAYGVLSLHGPPHHPQYYGQLERQNRDQDSWIRADSRPATERAVDDMMDSLNNLWPRRRLGWRTAGQAWAARPAIDVDRVQLRKEVELSCKRLLARKGISPSLGWRLAIEHALARRNLLHVKPRSKPEAGAR